MAANVERSAKQKLLDKIGAPHRTNGPGGYSIPFILSSNDEAAKVRKYTFGEAVEDKPEKVILLAGAAGSGKTTMANRFLNYIFDVQFEDDYYFYLDDDNKGDKSTSRPTTDWITSYTLFHQDCLGFNVPFNVTIVDTPGFGDKGGLDEDNKTLAQINTFFDTKGEKGIDHIDAVCLTVRAGMNTLTPVEKHIFDSIRGIFGIDIKDSIILIVTQDHSGQIVAPDVVKEAQVPIAEYYVFNNLVGQPGLNSAIGKLFWDKGSRDMERFSVKLGQMKPVSIILTQETLNERSEIEVLVGAIEQQIASALNTLETLKTQVKQLHEHEKEIEKNKDFQCIIPVEVVEAKAIREGENTSNCKRCSFTCHYPCMIAEDMNKDNCSAMSKSTGKCRACPKRCAWGDHTNERFRFVRTMKNAKKTYTRMKRDYETAKDKVVDQKELVNNMKEEFFRVEVEILQKMDAVRQALMRLRSISLLPETRKPTDYIDILIHKEKMGNKQWNTERILHLEKLRGRFEIISKLQRGKFNPFNDRDILINELKKASSSK